MSKKTSICITLFVAIFLTLPTFARADWQSDLQLAFPSAKVLETFDNLQDWDSGGAWSNDYQFCGGGGSDTTCPKDSDGSPSIWEYYTNKAPTFSFTQSIGIFAAGDVVTGMSSGASCVIAQVWNIDGVKYIQPTFGTGASASGFQPGEIIQTSGGAKTGVMLAWPEYIAAHGADRVWQGAGKSLVMDLGDNDSPDTAMTGLGAQRLGTYFGDGSVSSGLKKAHMFMMIKFSSNYFGAQPYAVGTNVLKFLDICSGFQSINDWGTAQDDIEAVDYGSMAEYGYNSSIFNWKGGGSSYPTQMFLSSNGYRVVSADGGITWHDSQAYGYEETSIDVVSPYASNGWFGLEIATDIGTVNNSDGSLEIWLYDSNGNQIGHQLRTELTHLGHFDHKYNKTTIGGNRRYGIDLSDRDLRYWVDDFIVNSDRIGLEYFDLLNGTADAVAPASPGGLSVM